METAIFSVGRSGAVLLPPVGQRRGVVLLPEELGEIAPGGEAALGGDIRDGLAGGAEPSGGGVQPAVDEIADGRGMQPLLKVPQARPGADVGGVGYLLQGDADFAPLTQFDRCSFDGFLGSAYSSYGVSELKKYPETFVWYEPKQSCTVNYYTQRFKFSATGSLFSSAKGYTKFIRGDGNAVQIQTGVQNGRKLLVVKDSFGNALAPFLIAGFEEVYFVDIRDFACNILTFIQEHQITDVSFSVSAFTVAGSKRDNITRLMNL